MHAHARARLQRALTDLADGRRSAFDDVFELAWPPMRALAVRLLQDAAEAEDVAQRALLKLFSHASRFDSERDALPWVLTFVINECRTVRGRWRRRPLVPLTQEPAGTSDPEAQLMRAELAAAVAEIAGTLTEADRVALGLQPAADLTPCAATRRKRKQRALGRLRHAWKRIHGLA